MGEQASVHSIEAIGGFRAALATFAEEVEAALGAVDMEVRRAVQWVQYDRRNFWQEQIKRRREAVASARSDLFRKQLQKKADHAPDMTEQKEALRLAEVRLRDAEQRVVLIKKWEPALLQAMLEYRASTRRIKACAADAPRAIFVLGRMVEALEAYLREAPPTLGEPAPIGAIVGPALPDDAWAEPAPADDVDESDAPQPEAR
jgi:hypothetical protein